MAFPTFYNPVISGKLRMSAPRDNRLITWYLLLKDEWLPAQWTRLKDWFSAVRAEPHLFWQTPQVRYGGIAVGVLVAVWFLAGLARMLEPANAREMQPQATTATFHVLCTNPDCKHHFLVERKFGFDDFPVQCPRCKQKTGQHAVRCVSTLCGGKYVAPIEMDGELRCPECGAVLGSAR